MILQMSLDSLFQLVLICGQDPLSHAGNFLSLTGPSVSCRKLPVAGGGGFLRRHPLPSCHQGLHAPGLQTCSDLTYRPVYLPISGACTNIIFFSTQLSPQFGCPYAKDPKNPNNGTGGPAPNSPYNVPGQVFINSMPDTRTNRLGRDLTLNTYVACALSRSSSCRHGKIYIHIQRSIQKCDGVRVVCHLSVCCVVSVCVCVRTCMFGYRGLNRATPLDLSPTSLPTNSRTRYGMSAANKACQQQVKHVRI